MKKLTPTQIHFLVELMEEIQSSAYKSESVVIMVKSHEFTDTLADLKRINLLNREEEDE
jgi:hypothetical protein